MSNELPASLGGQSRKRKLEKPVVGHNRCSRWISESEQRIYSTKLLDALRQASSPTSTRNVRLAADRVLAVSARGRTRWSRAILKNRRLRLRFSRRLRKVKNPNKKLECYSTSSGSRSEVEKRVGVLGRLVPGCRRVSFRSLLGETKDYIGALEMQVRAMATLAQLLTAFPDLTS